MNRIAGMADHRQYLWMIAAFSLIASLGILFDTSAFGEEKQVEVLTLEDALRIAAEKNRDIQKALEFKNQVEGRYVEERAAALPHFVITAYAINKRDESLEAFGKGFSLRNNTRSVELGLSQTLFTWGQIGAAIRAAKVGMATAEDQLRIFRHAASRAVSASFYDILLAKALHTIALENLDQKTRHYDEAQKKFSAGVATEYDILVSKVSTENARPAAIQAENLIRISREKLRFLLGRDGQEIDVMGSLEIGVLPYPIAEEIVEVAKNNRPELSDLRHRIGVANELVKVAQGGDKPKLDFQAGYGWREQDLGRDKANGAAWSAGLFVTYPIFDGLHTRGRVTQAKSNATTLRIEEAKLLDLISLEVRDTCNAVREAGEIVKALSGTVSQAERLLYLAEKGYEYGVKTRLDVEDAQLNLLQARVNLSRGKRDYLVALVNLEWVAGRIGETTHNK